jgi:hypothetical protein
MKKIGAGRLSRAHNPRYAVTGDNMADSPPSIDFSNRLGVRKVFDLSSPRQLLEKLQCTIEDLIDGQYRAPARVVAFNTADGWSRDVSEEIADELRTRINRVYVDVPPSLERFLDRDARDRPLQLPLPLKGAA